MTEIADFLRARYQERCTLAESAKPGPWHSDGGSVYATHPTDEVVSYSESADHIAANDPVDVIADLDAKIALIDEHPDVNDGNCGTCVNGQWGYPTHGGSSPAAHPCRTLRLLAQPFAGHPDHKGEEWAP